MFTDDVLDFARVDVEAAADDHVPGAIDDAQEAIGIAHRDIAAVQPATGKRLRSQFRVVAIAVSDNRPANADLDGLSTGHRQDRKSRVWGKSATTRVIPGGPRSIK